MRFVETRICPRCDKKWDVYKEKSPMRDKDSESYDYGMVIISWNGGVIYQIRPSETQT